MQIYRKSFSKDQEKKENELIYKLSQDKVVLID